MPQYADPFASATRFLNSAGRALDAVQIELNGGTITINAGNLSWKEGEFAEAIDKVESVKDIIRELNIQSETLLKTLHRVNEVSSEKQEEAVPASNCEISGVTEAPSAPSARVIPPQPAYSGPNF